jgi:tetratricopeptide (TPR) repeat protein
MLLNHYARTRQVEKLRQVVEQSLQDMLLLRTFYVYGGYCMLTIVGDGARAAQILQVALPLPVRDLDRVYFDEDLQKMLLSEHFLAKLLVRAYLVSGETGLARKTYQELLAKTPAVGAAAGASKKKLEQAELLLRSRQHMEVLKLLNPVHPKDAAALRLLGLAEAMLGGWALASDHFAAAVAMGGARPGDWSSLAVCELRAQNVGLAHGYARLALKENPRDAAAQGVLDS